MVVVRAAGCQELRSSKSSSIGAPCRILGHDKLTSRADVGFLVGTPPVVNLPKVRPVTA